MASNSELHLMTQLLNLEGVKVKDYRLIEGIGIILSLENTKKQVVCPSCGQTTELLHQNNFQTVRDLSFGQQAVYLKVNRRRMRCPHCDNKFTEELDFVRKKRVHTLRFVEKILEEVLNSDIKNVANRNDLSEQEIETMLKDLGADLVAEKPLNLKKLGIDEIAVVKGQKNYYVVLVDLEKKKVIGLVEKRTKEEIKEYLEAWGEEVLSKIQEVSIDLWKTYKNIAEELIPQAEIVADRFPVMKQVNDELDAGRRKIKREAEKMKNKSKKEKILEGLKKSKYVLLKNEKDLNEAEQEKLKELEKAVRPRVADRRKGTRTKKELNIREWTCLFCNTTYDRDVNAALNLRDAGGLSESKNERGSKCKTTMVAVCGEPLTAYKQLTLF